MTIDTISSSLEECYLAVVIPTTVIQLSARQALDFAEFLESENIAELLLEQRVLDSVLLKEPSENFFLDQALIAPVSPEAIQWLRERQCHRFPGCRVALCEAETLDDLMQDYRGSRWNHQGYTVIAASALETSIALELCDCPCLLQLELPDTSSAYGTCGSF